MRREKEAKEKAIPRLTNFFANKQEENPNLVSSRTVTAGPQAKQDLMKQNQKEVNQRPSSTDSTKPRLSFSGYQYLTEGHIIQQNFLEQCGSELMQNKPVYTSDLLV